MAEVVLTTEHQQIADEIYSRIEQYQQSHYQPALGWPKTSLTSDVQSALTKAEGSAPEGHSHTTDDVEGLSEFIVQSVVGLAPTEHKHSLADLNGFSTTATANTAVLRNSLGQFEVVDPAQPLHPASKKYVDLEAQKKADTVHTHTLTEVRGLQTVLDSKASSTHLHTIDQVSGLREALESSGGFDPSLLAGKADLVDGTVPDIQLPTLPLTKISGLTLELESRPKAVDGKYPRSVLPEIRQSDVEGLTDFINSQANTLKLVGGKVPVANLPQSVFQKPVRVSSVDEMLSLTTTQVRDGDVAVVTGGEGIGTYQLLGPPSLIGSWIKYTSEGAVQSVNNKTGKVTLTASDVGARPTGAIPLGDVTGLQTELDSKIEQSALDGLPTSQDLTTLQTELSSRSVSFAPVDFVATTRIASLSGQQSVDGTLVGVGKRVLLTNQASSSQNGIWVVSSTSWYRDTSMSEGTIVPRGALVSVLSGSENANTLWQMRASTPPRVGTESQSWHKVLTAGGGGVSFTAGDGLNFDGTTLSVKAGDNITVSSSGVSLDTTGLMRKWSGDVPAGSAVATVTHNLNTRDVYVAVYETGTGDQVLAGVTITGVNTAAIEFATAPATGAYRAVVFG